MLVDEIIHYESRRESASAAQVIVQGESPGIPLTELSTACSPRRLKKPKTVSIARHTHYHYSSPSTAPSFAHPIPALGPSRMASNASDSPVQSPSSNRRLLKSQPGSTVPLITPSFPLHSAPLPQVSIPISSPVLPSIPPPIATTQEILPGKADEQVENTTQSGSLEQPRPPSAVVRPLLNRFKSPGTPVIEIPSDPRKTEVNPPLVSRYSRVRNKRWALWGEWLYHRSSRTLTHGGSL
jgi:hypothetical protein